MESRSPSELSGLVFVSTTRQDVDDLDDELQLLNGVASVLCCTTGIHHFVAELRLGISTVFCACWSDAASQQARLPLNAGTALVESPLSSELSGMPLPGVASQPGTSTIQSVIRFEMRFWEWSGPLPLFLPRPVV